MARSRASNRYPNACAHPSCGTRKAVTVTLESRYTTPGITSWATARHPSDVCGWRPVVRLATSAAYARSRWSTIAAVPGGP